MLRAKKQPKHGQDNVLPFSQDETSPFFDEQQAHSKVKAEIVSKYFSVWAKIIINHIKKFRDGNIGYIDLFAGMGRYHDGSPSTPLLVLQHAVNDDDISKRLVSIFADKELTHVQCLQEEINRIPNINLLHHQPKVLCTEVEQVLEDFLKVPEYIPSIFFLDPCGYKGLTLDLVQVAIRDWACECIFFFNYSRINAALENDNLKCHMDDLFGEDRAKELRSVIKGKSPEDREEHIMKGLFSALRGVHGKFVLPFRFRNYSDTRTSHYLVFVTKKFRGFEEMRKIMAKHSSDSPQGVPSFEYNPPALRQDKLFDLSQHLDNLMDSLLQHFAGRELTMRAIYDQHSPGQLYVISNYKSALLQLEKAGKIIAQPANRRAGTFGDTVNVQFPAKGDK